MDAATMPRRDRRNRRNTRALWDERTGELTPYGEQVAEEMHHKEGDYDGLDDDGYERGYEPPDAYDGRPV